MSKLLCPCGEIIRDQSDQLPYKGYLSSDATYFDAFDRASTDVTSFIQARESGAERRWLSDYFGAQYPSLGMENIIHDIITRHLFPEHRDVYECPRCHRLLIERHDEPRHFRSFTPEETSAPSVFT